MLMKENSCGIIQAKYNVSLSLDECITMLNLKYVNWNSNEKNQNSWEEFAKMRPARNIFHVILKHDHGMNEQYPGNFYKNQFNHWPSWNCMKGC